MGRIGGNPGNKGGGRKTRGAELALVEWYKALLPKTFSIVEQMLRSDNKLDRLWAMDWLKTGLVKMIPQKIGGDPDNTTPIPIYAKISINGEFQKHDSNGKDIQPEKKD